MVKEVDGVMPQIALLSQETIDKIAAGEVIERPSSVVKELVENAIDAGSSAVTVEIKEGGISFIRISDNGCGIEREQIPLAFLRHSTSKIKSVEDLFTVTSLGFRGEALSSIAAVSQVELITKTNGDFTGSHYLIEGSKEVSLEEIGAPDGTTFIVRNLFYNTPARKKFLKSAQTEGTYIHELMQRMILSHPDVAFKFIMNNQVKLQSSGNGNIKDIIYHLYGRDITKALLPIAHESELFKVSGFIGKPMISRGNRGYELYFVNGRFILCYLNCFFEVFGQCFQRVLFLQQFFLLVTGNVRDVYFVLLAPAFRIDPNARSHPDSILLADVNPHIYFRLSCGIFLAAEIVVGLAHRSFFCKVRDSLIICKNSRALIGHFYSELLKTHSNTFNQKQTIFIDIQNIIY